MRSAKYLQKLIDIYQKFISPLKTRGSCVFYPTCSEYAKEAIKKYGAIRGLYLGSRRLLRCHPWQKNHIDPVK